LKALVHLLLVKRLPEEVPEYGQYTCHTMLTTGGEQDACTHPLGNADLIRSLIYLDFRDTLANVDWGSPCLLLSIIWNV